MPDIRKILISGNDRYPDIEKIPDIVSDDVSVKNPCGPGHDYVAAAGRLSDSESAWLGLGVPATE